MSYSASFNASNNQMVGASYDAAGNMTQDPAGATPRHTYTYDADGNLTAVDGGSTGQYYYDSLNNRVRTAAVRGGQSQTYEFVFDVAGRRVSTWGAGNQAFAGLQIYSDFGPVATRWNDALYFEHTNWLGTKREVTDHTGANVEQVTSLPFGDGRATTGPNAGNDADWYDFAGLDDDTEDATEHAQFRNYSPAQGRWFTPDPYYGSYDASNPQSFNRYAYALNNPVSFTDTSGLDCVEGEGGIGTEACNDPNDPNDPTNSGNTGGGQPGDPGWLITYAGSGQPGDPGTDGDAPVNAGTPFTMQVDATLYLIQAADPFSFGYVPAGSLSGSGWQLAGAIPAGGIYGPQSGLTNNCISPGVCKSSLDNNLNLMEKGKTNYRDALPTCSTHTTVDNSTGETNSHLDLFNPGASLPTMNGSIPLLPFHLLFDALPDFVYNKAGFYPWPAGRSLCQ